MSDLISRKAILEHIEKIRQGVQMMDDTHRASIIMSGMHLCEKAVRNQPSALPTQTNTESTQKRVETTQDCISRQAAIEVADAVWMATGDKNVAKVWDQIKDLPSAQPDLDEWCTDCSEYDRERHYCPRWNRVIRQTLKDAQPERQIELDGMESNVEILSELRAQFNCFDEVEEPVYRALSDAICALSAQPERKKGEWIDLGKDKAIRWQCSECGRKDTHIYNYCPDCGSDNRWY